MRGNVEGNEFDAEIQTTNRHLPKRTRANHMLMCYNALNKENMKTHSYRDLHDAFVIFICTFDPFGEGRHVYTFYNMCEEVPGLKLNDGAYTVFLNAVGTCDDVSIELKNFLDFVVGKNSCSDDSFIDELSRRLNLLRHDSNWRRDYMWTTLFGMDKFYDGYENGYERGHELGLELGRELGRELGLELGAQNKALEIARTMRGKGMNDNDIHLLTNLSLEEIQSL